MRPAKETSASWTVEAARKPEPCSSNLTQSSPRVQRTGDDVDPQAAEYPHHSMIASAREKNQLLCAAICESLVHLSEFLRRRDRLPPAPFPTCGPVGTRCPALVTASPRWALGGLCVRHSSVSLHRYAKASAPECFRRRNAASPFCRRR